MIIHNMRLAFRHLSRQKLNTSLHIIGLSIGMSVCLLIALFIRYELSFDAYHDKSDRTYRVVSKWIYGEKQDFHFSTPFPLANTIRNEVSGLEHVSFAHPVYTKVVEITPQKRFLEDHILAVEPEFLELFNLDVTKGDLYKTLRQPYQAVLTESTAQKFFGKEDPIGKTFRFTVDKEFDFTVGAIVKDLPPNTHLPASIFVSYSYSENFLRPNLDGWTYVSGTETLIVVPMNPKLTNIKAQLTAIADKYINKDQGEPNFRSDFELQPLNNVHFNESYGGGGGWVPSISASWLWFFAVIGLAVLVLACINFMNLSTAQALTRAKEVGVRKSIGAGKFNLMLQFLSEAWILTFLSGIIAIALAQLFLPSINTLLDKNISFDLMQSPKLLSMLLVSITAIGLLAGIYPAWIIARFNPTTTMKVGTMASADLSSNWLRKGLVVIQFTISVGLLMILLLIGRQVDFLRSKNLGFNKDNIINVEIKSRANKELVFKNELNKIAQIKDISFATATPSSEGHWGTIMNRNNREDPTRKDVTLIFGDERFCKMYDLNLITGRLLEASDTNYISRTLPEEKQMMKAVVNEKLIHELGFKSNEAALGEHIYLDWLEQWPC